MTDEAPPTPSEQTPEQRQRLREFLTSADLISINNAIAAGALPEDACLAKIAAGVNALRDLMPIPKIETLVNGVLDRLKNHREPPRIAN